MGAVINWMYYVWLVTSEVLEELIFNAGDFFRRIAFAMGTKEKASRIESRMYTRPSSTAKVTDTI